MKFQGSIFWNSTKYNIFAECFTFFQWKFREKESNRYPGKVCKALLIMICLLVVYNSSNPSSFPSTRIPSSFFLSSLSFSLPSPLFRSLSKFDESGDGKIAFSKFSSAENKVGRVSNGYPEYPIANLHVTETYPPLSPRWIFPRDASFLRLISGRSPYEENPRSRFPIPLPANKTRTGGYCFSYHTIVPSPPWLHLLLEEMVGGMHRGSISIRHRCENRHGIEFAFLFIYFFLVHWL